MVEQFTGKTSCSIIQTGFYDVASFRCVVGFCHSVPPSFFENRKSALAVSLPLCGTEQGLGKALPNKIP